MNLPPWLAASVLICFLIWGGGLLYIFRYLRNESTESISTYYSIEMFLWPPHFIKFYCWFAGHYSEKEGTKKASIFISVHLASLVLILALSVYSKLG